MYIYTPENLHICAMFRGGKKWGRRWPGMHMNARLIKPYYKTNSSKNWVFSDHSLKNTF